MTQADTNIAVLRHGFDLLSAGKVDELAEWLTDDFIINIAGVPTRYGRDTWREGVAEMRSAFSDLRAQVDDIFGADDKVAVRLTFTGTHTGEFQGIAPTGREVSYTSAELYRFRDDSIAEEWIFSDVPTLMRQLTAPA